MAKRTKGPALAVEVSWSRTRRRWRCRGPRSKGAPPPSCRSFPVFAAARNPPWTSADGHLFACLAALGTRQPFGIRSGAVGHRVPRLSLQSLVKVSHRALVLAKPEFCRTALRVGICIAWIQKQDSGVLEDQFPVKSLVFRGQTARTKIRRLHFFPRIRPGADYPRQEKERGHNRTQDILLEHHM